ncbi:hypothetical protein KY285_007797 [Solanum tuberosum]|nr:hypothetical protein KY285_007797 [Solanum tuberosum]
MVQLEEVEVQVEEDKWKCAFIAYVIGECPGYNTMHRYITMNWTAVTKSDEERPKKRRPGKKVTQVWKYKGLIQLKEKICVQNRGQEAREIKHCNKTDKGNHEIEKEQGKQNSEEITQFNLRPNAGDCVKDIGITELQWQVHYYSWTNKQHGTDRISSRIDRVFGNYEWMEKWGHVTTEYGNPSISDHCPMQLTMQITQHNVKVKFKFFNVWTEHDSFMSLVVSVWKQDYGKGSMKKVWCKLIALQLALRQLNNKEFKYISQQIEKARYELSRIQEELYDEATDDLVEQEKEIMMKLEKWSMIEESALRQKSRTRWIQLGDANNKYFSAIIKERTQKKQIRCITSLMDR